MIFKTDIHSSTDTCTSFYSDFLASHSYVFIYLSTYFKTHSYFYFLIYHWYLETVHGLSIATRICIYSNTKIKRPFKIMDNFEVVQQRIRQATFLASPNGKEWDYFLNCLKSRITYNSGSWDLYLLGFEKINNLFIRKYARVSTQPV